MTETDAVLATNLDFYRAFTNQDLEAMDGLWAKRAMVLCTHPGWTPLSGRIAVMASWHDILSHPEAPAVMCHDDQAFLYGEVAIVLCEEDSLESAPTAPAPGRNRILGELGSRLAVIPSSRQATAGRVPRT